MSQYCGRLVAFSAECRCHVVSLWHRGVLVVRLVCHACWYPDGVLVFCSGPGVSQQSPAAGARDCFSGGALVGFRCCVPAANRRQCPGGGVLVVVSSSGQSVVCC